MVLFKGLNRKQANKNNDLSTDVCIIKAPSELLDETIKKGFVKKIKELIKSSYFEDLYLPLIKEFAEFVQNIPENNKDFFNKETEFLELGLERATRALSLCLNYFFPEKNNFSDISSNDALWLYTLFSVALCMDIGKIAVKYSILLYHDKSYPLKVWDPFRGSMREQAKYYRFELLKENHDSLRTQITPLLVRQLMDKANTSEKGFNWIASKKEVLQAWFAFLSGEESRVPMTSFMSVIPRAEIEMLENYRKKFKLSMMNPAGEAFLNWLRKKIQEKILNLKNDKLIFIKGKEVFLSKKLFKIFAKENALYKHPENIETQFIDIAKLYQISISELDQRYRSYGGLSGLNTLSSRYRTIGGISAIAEHAKTKENHFLKGGIGLLSLLATADAFIDKYFVLPKSNIQHSHKNS